MLIRVFVDASPHIPEHRQLPLFTHLICTVGSTQFLHTAVILLLEKHIVHGQATADENQVSVSMRTVLCKCNAKDTFLCLFSGLLMKVCLKLWEAMMVQWWEASPPTDVAWVQFRPSFVNYASWVCCWFSPYSKSSSPDALVFLHPQKTILKSPIRPRQMTHMTSS